MNIRIALLAAAAMFLYHSPQAQRGLGIELETQVFVPRIAKQYLPGTILGKGSGYQSEFRSGLLVGPRLVYGFSDDFELSAGFVMGKRKMWQKTGSEFATFRQGHREFISMMPAEFAWTPLLSPESKLRMLFSAGGALIWNNSIRMSGGVSRPPQYNTNLRLKLEAVKKRPGEPIPMLALGAGFQWHFAPNTALRFSLNYQWALAKDYNVLAQWGGPGAEDSLTKEYRTRFLTFRLGFFLPFRILKGSPPDEV